MSLTLGPRGAAASQESFVERLDRVPLNRFHWRLLGISGIGWMFDAMDVIMISFLLSDGWLEQRIGTLDGAVARWLR